MGFHILLDYLKQNPETEVSALSNIYAYFKFKAYLQTTLRYTRKAYCIKEGNASANLFYLPPEDLYRLSESMTKDVPDGSPYDVEWAVGQLEPAQAEIIRLYFYCGKTELEIARDRNVSRQAINNLKHRALCKLRKFLVTQHAYQ